MGDYLEEEVLNENIPEASFAKEDVTTEEGPDLNETELEVFQCDQCSKVFKTRRYLIRHKARCASEQKRNYKCLQCEKTLKNIEQFRIHNRYAHATDRAFQCELCPRKYATASFLKIHLRKHSKERQYKCDLCPKTYKSLTGVNGHKAIVHNIGSRFRCKECEKTFLTPSSFKEHMIVHTEERNMRCDQCDKAFKGRRNLRDHQRYAHPTERPFKCESCTESFACASFLKIHSKKHFVESFECDLCSEALTTQYSLVRHKAWVHDIGDKFSCEKCGKRFVNPSRFKRHRLLHSREKYFESETLKTEHSLVRHKAWVHSMGQRFANLNRFKKRNLVHVIKGIYSNCDQCNKSFVYKHDLVTHKINAHVTKAFRSKVGVKGFKTSPLSGSTDHTEEKVQASLNMHEIEQHNIGEEFVSEQCGKKFTFGSELMSHCTKKPSNSNLSDEDFLDPPTPETETTSSKFSCEQCGKTFRDPVRFKYHLIGHSWDVKFTCDQCDNSFMTRIALGDHERAAHATERPFQCEVCLAKFATIYSLKHHSLKNHTKEKPHTCEYCSESFRTELDLIMHDSVEHGTGDRFSCKQCGKRFKVPSKFKEHLAWHDEDKNFSCDQCDKKFRERNNLDVHKRYAHATGQPAQCEKYPKGSTISVKRAEQKPFKCEWCSKSYKESINLATHEIKVHGEGDSYPSKGRGTSFKECKIGGDPEFEEMDVKVEPVEIYDPETQCVVVPSEMDLDVKQEPEEFD